MSDPNQSIQESATRPLTPELALSIGEVGLMAVESANRIAEIAMDSATPEEAKLVAEYEIDRYSPLLDGHTIRERNAFASDENMLELFHEGVAGLNPPEFLNHALGAEDTRSMVRNAVLGAENPRARMNFYQWYNGTISDRRNRFDESERPMFLHTFQNRLASIEADNAVAPGTLESFKNKEAAGKIPVQFTDVLSTQNIKAGVYHFANGLRLIQMGNADKGVAFEHNLTHEFAHTLEGTAVPEEEGNETQLSTEQFGLGRVFGGGVGGTVMREATTELLADTLIHGNIEEVDPHSDLRKNSEVYKAEQLLLAVICRAGIKHIDPRVFTKAITIKGPLETTPELQRVPIEIESAFPGMNVTSRIKNLTLEDGENQYDAAVRLATEIFYEAQKLDKAE